MAVVPIEEPANGFEATLQAARRVCDTMVSLPEGSWEFTDDDWKEFLLVRMDTDPSSKRLELKGRTRLGRFVDRLRGN